MDDKEFDVVLQTFYRAPDVAGAVRAFEEMLGDGRRYELQNVHAFVHLAAVSPQVRAGFERLRDRDPTYVEAILKGFEDPRIPRVGDGPPRPEELDLLWCEFFITGSTAPVRRVIAVLDESDFVREQLQRWLVEIGTGPPGRRTFERFVPLFARCMFPVRFESSTIDGPVDLDLQVALSAREGKLKFAELPFPVSQEQAIRIAAKSAAIWSLRALSGTHAVVARTCAEEAKKPGGAARVLLAP